MSAKVKTWINAFGQSTNLLSLTAEEIKKNNRDGIGFNSTFGHSNGLLASLCKDGYQKFGGLCWKIDGCTQYKDFKNGVVYPKCITCSDGYYLNER